MPSNVMQSLVELIEGRKKTTIVPHGLHPKNSKTITARA
jgi:hypothetical protein